MQDDQVAHWGAPRVTILGPLVIVALIDGAIAAGSPSAGGWWFAAGATVVGVFASALFSASFVALTDAEVVFRNGLFVTRVPRPAIRAVEASRNGVDFFYATGGESGQRRPL